MDQSELVQTVTDELVSEDAPVSVSEDVHDQVPPEDGLQGPMVRLEDGWRRALVQVGHKSTAGGSEEKVCHRKKRETETLVGSQNNHLHPRFQELR